MGDAFRKKMEEISVHTFDSDMCRRGTDSFRGTAGSQKGKGRGRERRQEMAVSLKMETLSNFLALALKPSFGMKLR